VTPCGLSAPFLDVQLGGTFAGDVNFTPTEPFAAGAIVGPQVFAEIRSVNL
jgi:hypothetical protein